MSAEAAAVFAAGLDFGLLSTFEAADAAFALVTSLFDFAILFTSFLSLMPFSHAFLSCSAFAQDGRSALDQNPVSL